MRPLRPRPLHPPAVLISCFKTLMPLRPPSLPGPLSEPQFSQRNGRRINPLSQSRGSIKTAVTVHTPGPSSPGMVRGRSSDRPPRVRPGRGSPPAPWNGSFAGERGALGPSPRGGLWFHFLQCHGLRGGIGAQLGGHRGWRTAANPAARAQPTPTLALQAARMGAGPSGHPLNAFAPQSGEHPSKKSQQRWGDSFC